MDSCTKEGFLQKAGKHSFQGWRKRWFVLNGDNMKYYNPGSEYNENSLLGTIQMFEIQSVSPSKSMKYGFDIITRSRTYNVSAKTDLERDDWILMLRKASNSKRRLDSKSSLADAPSPDPQPSGKAMKALKKETTKKKKDKSSKQNKRENKGQDNQGSTIVEDTSQPIETTTKPRAATCVLPTTSEKQFETKPRASSQSDLLAGGKAGSIRANSILRKMSSNADEEENTGSLYKQLDEKLGDSNSNIAEENEEDLTDDDATDDESDDESDDPNLSSVKFSYPPPREGETYAFDEIKKYLGNDLMGMQQCNLETIKNAYNYKMDDEDEYPSISLLKLHLQCLK